MKTNKIAALGLLGGLFAIGLILVKNNTEGSVNRDRAMLAALHNENARAINTFDLDHLLAGVTDDVVYLAPAEPEVVGKAALEADLRGKYAQAKGPGIQITASDLIISGDVAYEWGRIEAANQSPRAVNGKYLYVYRRQSGKKWRIARMVFTPDEVPAVVAASLTAAGSS